jgi:hypothetical protein
MEASKREGLKILWQRQKDSSSSPLNRVPQRPLRDAILRDLRGLRAPAIFEVPGSQRQRHSVNSERRTVNDKRPILHHSMLPFPLREA